MASKKSERHVSSFNAASTAGHEIAIEIWQTFISVASLDHPLAEMAGSKRLVTIDGQNVHRLGQGRYRTVDNGEEFTSVDPNAV